MKISGGIFRKFLHRIIECMKDAHARSDRQAGDDDRPGGGSQRIIGQLKKSNKE